MAISPAVANALRNAATLMNQQRFAEARRLLEPASRAQPGLADARFLLGAALLKLGDAAGAERELGAALAIDPSHDGAASDLARLLNATGRHDEAITATDRFADAVNARSALLNERAAAFQTLGRHDELVAIRERIAARSPDSFPGQHNLAAALGDAGLAERAETVARRALRAGDAPETWLVLARALQSQNRYDEAEAAFRAALQRRPVYVDALRDLSQLVWMRTGTLDAASAVLDVPAPPAERRLLRAIRARLHQYAGDARGGYALLMREALAGDARLEVAAAHLAMGFDPAAALAHARRAAAHAPQDEAVQRQLIDSYLAVGEAEKALALLGPLLDRHPLDQGLIAVQWTAWRLLGDARAGDLYDYARMVGAQTIDTPPGWPSLDAYLADLGVALRRLHGLEAHPFDQSLRHGTQTSANLLQSSEPTIRAFVAAIDGPIRRYLALLSSGTDRLRSRNRFAYRIAGLWSVRLRDSGFHVDHVHPMGWLSSAFYVVLPESRDGAGQAGWIKFGQPGTPSLPALASEFAIQPLPGLLVLFPSYMWHGTTPFDRGERITIAFDLAPA